MFGEPAIPSKRSGQIATAMSASVKSELEPHIVWCVDMFEWKTARLRGVGNSGWVGGWAVIRLWKQVTWMMHFLIYSRAKAARLYPFHGEFSTDNTTKSTNHTRFHEVGVPFWLPTTICCL